MLRSDEKADLIIHASLEPVYSTVDGSLYISERYSISISGMLLSLWDAYWKGRVLDGCSSKNGAQLGVRI